MALENLTVLSQKFNGHLPPTVSKQLILAFLIDAAELLPERRALCVLAESLIPWDEGVACKVRALAELLDEVARLGQEIYQVIAPAAMDPFVNASGN
jgi:hypothetical protein